MTRKAVLFVWEWDKEYKKRTRVLVGPVRFHGWGHNYEEFETGPGSYSVAIIEHPDGRCDKVVPELITFDPPTKEGE